MSQVPSSLVAALADRYRIERELGAGGMATVYLAEDLKHDRQVAIKVLRPELAAALGAERFLREITITARLDHPHILPLLDSGETGEPDQPILYYVMPFVDGESLRDRLQREKQLPLDDAMQIAREVADALSYAHSRNIIHRDIKPENILLSGGHARVADFGIGRAVSAAGGDTLTQTGMAIGTPIYMSPEQAAGQKDLDGRSDLYALACVLFEMLAGQPPFTGPTTESIVHQHLMAPPPPITQLRPAVPAEVAAALQRALAKTPADRFNPVAQFSEALRPGSRTYTAPAVAAAAAPPRMRSQRRPLIAAAAIVGILGIAALVFWRSRTGSANAAFSSVAVLPFVDLSPDRNGQYLGDGISETLINALANVPGLSVAARTSAFSFRGKSEDVREIGRQLGVAAVLEGSVQRAGERLRVTAQLIATSNGLHLWSRNFDRSAGDIFAVQDEVAGAVVAALDRQSPSGRAKINTSEATRDPQAYDLYLQGRFFWSKRTVADLRKAAGLFEQALARDSLFSLAWAGLADTYIALPFYADTSTVALLRKARSATEHALALNPDLGEAHASLAYLLMLEDWDWTGSEREFERAIALSPSYPTAYKWHADLQSILNQDAAAIASLQRARELDPLSAMVLANLGSEYQTAGQDSAAVALVGQSLELDPTNPLALRMVADDYFARGDTAAFFRVEEQLNTATTRAGASVAELRRAFARGGRDAMIRAEIAALSGHDLRVERARWRVRLGDLTGAIQDLTQAVAERQVWATYITGDRDLAPLWNEPRFLPLVEQMGLTPYRRQ